MLVPFAFCAIFAASFLGLGGQNGLECGRERSGAPPRCTITRSILGVETDQERFTLTGASLGRSEDDDGVTYRVHLKGEHGQTIPLTHVWTNVGLSSMRESVAEARRFQGDPSALHLKLRDDSWVLTIVGLLAAVCALILLGVVLWSAVQVLIFKLRVWIRGVRARRRVRKLDARIQEERPEDNRPSRLTPPPAHLPEPDGPTEWPLSDWPRPLGAPWWRRLLWRLRLARASQRAGTARGDVAGGGGALALADRGERRVELESPFVVQLSVRLVSAQWLDVNVQLSPKGGRADGRVELRVRLPHRMVASQVVELDTDAPYMDADAFIAVVWPTLAHYAELHGQRLGQQLTLSDGP